MIILKLDHKEHHYNQAGVLQKLYKSLLRWFFVIGFVLCPIVSFILAVTIFRRFSNVNWESSMMPRCFCYIDWVTFALLNTKEGWGSSFLFVLRLKMISWICLVGSGLKFIFPWKAQLCIISTFLIRSFAEVWLSWITENKDISSANNF